jgi:urea transporter
MTWEIVVGLITICGAAVTLGTVLARLVRTLTRLDASEWAAELDRRINHVRIFDGE